MSGVYLCVCACTTTYLHLRYTRPCPYYRCTAARHETHHGHVLRHAIEQVYYHGHDPPRTIHPHLCRWLLRRSRDLDILVSFAPRLFSSFLFFFFSSFVRLTLFLSFRYSPLPHPPCYRVQGQPIEGNFLVPIAFVRLPRTIRFVSFPLFYSSEPCFFFSRYTFPFFLASLSIYFSFSLLFHKVSLQIREGRCQNGGEKHRWKLVRNAFDR